MPEVTSSVPGAFCWVELGTSDQNAAKEFYGKLFGWSFDDLPMGEGGPPYTTFRLKGKAVAAGYTLDPKMHAGVPPHWMVYVATSDADATAARAGELGGQAVMPPFDVFDFGRMCVIKDPTGAMISIWQAKTHQGIELYNEHGAFCWGQLNTGDTAKAEAFYKALFGWGSKPSPEYTEWMLNGTPIGGMMTIQGPPGTPPHWLAYFAVNDCDATAAQAAALGATTFVPPTDIPGTGRFAVFADPQGAVFAIYREVAHSKG